MYARQSAVMSIYSTPHVCGIARNFNKLQIFCTVSHSPRRSKSINYTSFAKMSAMKLDYPTVHKCAIVCIDRKLLVHFACGARSATSLHRYYNNVLGKTSPTNDGSGTTLHYQFMYARPRWREATQPRTHAQTSQRTEDVDLQTDDRSRALVRNHHELSTNDHESKCLRRHQTIQQRIARFHDHTLTSPRKR